MNDFVELIKKYQETKDEILFKEIIDFSVCNISKKLKSYSDKYYYEDLIQEFKMCICKYIDNFVFDDNAIEITDLNKLLKKDKEFVLKNLKTELDDKCLKSFIQNKGLKLFCKAFDDKAYLEEFNREYIKHVNNLKYVCYLKKTLNSVTLNFSKNFLNDGEVCNSLNERDHFGVEIIDTIICKQTEECEKFYLFMKFIDKDEQSFINSLIEDNRVLPQRILAKKLNISQQAVSKKFMKIKKKGQAFIKREQKRR